jgi:transcriptional regulator with XRE-family HTH domain
LDKGQENNKVTPQKFCIKKYKRNDEYFVHLLSIENITKALKEARLKRKLSTKELSTYLNIHESTLSRVENNAYEARLSNILKIFDRLNAKVYFQVELQPFWQKFNANKKRELKNKKK